MQHHCRLSRVDAHKLLTEGRFLLRYGTVAEAAVTGCLSGSQIRSIRSAVTSVLADLFDEHQQTVVDAVTGLDPVATSQVCQTWRQRGEAIIDRPEPSVADRIFKWSKLEDGTVVGQFVFDPTSGAIILAALANARTDDRGDERTHAQTHADAVTTMAAFFNANHDGDGTPRHLPHVGLELHLTQRSAAEVHDLLYPDCDRRDCSNHDTCEPDALFDAVFGAGLRMTTDDGTVLPAWAAAAFSCDCVINRVLTADTALLDYGTSVRSAPRDLFRAVAKRDRGCRFHGCDRKVAWCDAHHVKHWIKDGLIIGETKLSNLVLFCSYHHHLIHREHWHVTLDLNAEVTVTHPDGRGFTTRPRGSPLIREPVKQLAFA